MFSLQRTLTLNYLGQHPTRTALVVASIALGVAALVGTQALNRGQVLIDRLADQCMGELVIP